MDEIGWQKCVAPSFVDINYRGGKGDGVNDEEGLIYTFHLNFTNNLLHVWLNG